MKKKLFSQVLCTLLISSLVFSSVDVPAMAADQEYPVQTVDAEEIIAEEIESVEIPEEQEEILTEGEYIVPETTVETTYVENGETKTGSITWSIDANGHLSVSGNGNYSVATDDGTVLSWPWADKSGDITSASISLNNFNYATRMFSNCEKLESIEFVNIDTGLVENMESMFSGCSNLTELDVTKLDTGNVENMKLMFSGCSSLTSLDLSKFNTDKVTNMSGMFNGCSKLSELNLNNINTENVETMESMFWGCSSLSGIDIEKLDTSSVSDMSTMFASCDGLTDFSIDTFDTSNVVNMRYMFWNCRNLEKLELSNFNTENVTDMSGMFEYCTSLSTLSINCLSTENVTDMSGMFQYCWSLPSLNLSNFKTDNVTDMRSMFYECKNLSGLDVSKFVTTKVTDMGFMFEQCTKLLSLDLSNFDTSNVTDMCFMFEGCTNLSKLNLSSFNTSKVEDMNSMFNNCDSLESLDLSNFDMNNVTEAGEMCSNSDMLQTIQTPVNLNIDAKLPGTWKKEDGTQITTLPKGLENSITITKDFVAEKVSFSLDQDTLSLIEEEEATLVAAIKNLPEDASTPSTTWKSSDETVATVDENGKITAIAAGEAIITATSSYTDDEHPDGYTASCNVTVTAKAPVDVTGVTLSYNNAEISENGIDVAIGDSVTLQAKISPEDATNKKVTWTTSDEEVATVSGGVVKGITSGNAVITVTTEDGEFSANCKVNVITVSVNDVAITYRNSAVSANGLTLNIGNKLTLSASMIPANATEKSVSWNSSNTKVAMVSDNGLVTAIASGNAVITVTTKDGGKTASCNIAVVSGNGTDSASENKPPVKDENEDNKQEEEQKTTYKVSVKYDNNGLVSANRTGSVSDGDVSDIVSSNNTNSFDVTVEEDKTVVFTITPNAEFGIASVKITGSKYDFEEVSGNAVKSEDGNIEISAIDKDGNVTVTIKSLSENTSLEVGFKRTTFRTELKIDGVSGANISLIDDKFYDASGKEITSVEDIKAPEKKGEVFSGWVTADGIKVTMENLADIIKSGKTLVPKYAYVNVVVKQKVDITGLLNVSANDIFRIKKYQITYNGAKNSKYASVTSKGIVTAKKVEKDGKPITVKVEALDAKKNVLGGCYVTITATKANVDIVKKASASLNQIGASYDMNEILTSLPENSYDKIVWSVPKNCKYAKIDENGKLTALDKSGKVKVTAEFINTNGGKTSAKISFYVTVKLPKQASKKATVRVNKTKTLKLSNLSGQKVSWSTDKAGYVSLDNASGTDNGKGTNSVVVTGKKAGPVKVTAIVNGDTAHPYVYEITVK